MPNSSKNSSEVNNDMNVDSLTEKRLWQTLDGMNEKLSGIESKLIEVVRLEEKVNQHDNTLTRFGGRLDKQENKMHESSVEKLIANVQTELQGLNKDLDEVRKTQHINSGQKDVGKDILKWAVGILTAILVYKLTRG